jgi:hypothetical protein
MNPARLIPKDRFSGLWKALWEEYRTAYQSNCGFLSRWLFLYVCYELFHFMYHYWQIRVDEAHFRCRNAMMFNIGLDMLMMRMGTLRAKTTVERITDGNCSEMVYKNSS